MVEQKGNNIYARCRSQNHCFICHQGKERRDKTIKLAKKEIHDNKKANFVSARESISVHGGELNSCLLNPTWCKDAQHWLHEKRNRLHRSQQLIRRQQDANVRVLLSLFCRARLEWFSGIHVWSNKTLPWRGWCWASSSKYHWASLASKEKMFTKKIQHSYCIIQCYLSRLSGSSGSKVAHNFMKRLVEKCSFVVFSQLGVERKRENR